MNKISQNPQVSTIIAKILSKKQSPTLIYDKYIEQEQTVYQSRLKNCELHEKNLQLQREFRKLKKILNVKLSIKTKLQKTDMEINQIREKLMSVLNVSRILQQSICRIRRREKNSSYINNVTEVDCCCSRRKTHRQQHKKQSKPKNTKKSLGKQNSQNNTDQIKQIFKKLDLVDCQIQCDINYLEKQKKNLCQKKEYLQKLRKIIDNQHKMIDKYEKTLGSQPNIGKITKTGSLKQGVNLKTSASIGSIIKVIK